MKRLTILFFLAFAMAAMVVAQGVNVQGRVVDADDGRPVEFASVLLKESGLAALTDAQGYFTIRGVQPGSATVVVQCLGYVRLSVSLQVAPGLGRQLFRLRSESLKLDEVEVVAKRKNDEATTSYTVDRLALDNQQILNIGDVVTLLPGGKTVNSSLLNDSRFALRSSEGERGNASFGTAVEVDGLRLDNNAAIGETMAASTRAVSASNVESVEIVTGIPSVEYGDLSNGIVKINTRRGKSPFIVEGKLNQHTTQLAVNKGFDLGHGRGLFNASVEHARSFSDIASPHTAYRRNVLSLNYMNVFFRSACPLTLNVSFTGNVGGYNSKADPDRDLDDYSKVRDNAFAVNLSVDWLLNKPWLTSLALAATVSYADKRTETYANTSSASAQPYIHTQQEGYFIASDYDANPTADIILGPTGYWYVRRYNDSRPLNYTLKLKANWNRRLGRVRNRLLVGADFRSSRNLGQGTYYTEPRYTPTWRAYRYDGLPALNILAFYAENKVSVPTGRRSLFELTAGVRNDITLISGSAYGTVSTLSPRANARYIFFQGRKHWFSSLSMHAGWGKSVKAPSFQVLYPEPSYSDRLAFAPGSTAQNQSFYAYYTHPTTAIYNPELKWQYAHQTDIGVELTVLGTRISVSGFRNKTFNPYKATTVYSPFAYKFTGQQALEGISIPSADRSYSVDRQTGIVTVHDRTGRNADVQLGYSERRSYLTNTRYVNASPVERRGLEWIVDFAPIRALHTGLRLDGNYYYYKGTDETLFADVPMGLNANMSNGQPYGYIGYYRGGSATSTSYAANASVANGSLTHEVNLNATLTTHIPRVRLIIALRVEASLYSYSRALSEYHDGTRGYVLAEGSDYFGLPYDGSARNSFVAVYPEYYSTWDSPGVLIPFAERFAWARDNDRTLFNDLSRLVVRSNYAYTMNPNKLSRYCSANISVTKEIGNHVSVSFYANNFWNTMRQVRSSQTGLETSLFDSGYIPKFYYGLSLRLKL